MVPPINRAYVNYAEAVKLGRGGQAVDAAETVAQGDGILANAPWYLHTGRRLISEAAIRDGWGDPAVWLRDAERFFDGQGYQAFASACRSLLRACGGRSMIRRGH